MTKENLNMNPEELTQKGISYLEEAILTVISASKDEYIKQKEIAITLGIYDCWERSKWLVQTILNKLDKEKRIVPKIKVLANGRKSRDGWKLTEAERDHRAVGTTVYPSVGGMVAEPGTVDVPGIEVKAIKC